MASGNITEDGNSPQQYVLSNGEGVHLALAGSFGGGSVAVEQKINDTFHPLLSDAVAVAFTAAADVKLNIINGDIIRLVTTGSTTPDIDFNIAGAGLVR